MLAQFADWFVFFFKRLNPNKSRDGCFKEIRR